ncbi:PREDICTED: proteoglycan 4 [Cyprinodon variegatus]|uniref:proteoglycan 4 n=1 Tax=Cyprinodon variegatus TaxID=28743 RepID=UPI00074287C5|nr:PREDICTED: proteoglycan 4 [Cyprinodon variegatus]
MKKMMKNLGIVLLCLAAAASATGPGSCVGRCGEVFTRGQQCTCDFSCIQHKECCPDFQAICTTTPSCQGRCGETYRRGMPCECDPMCLQYNTCCPDFQLHCDAAVTIPRHGSSQSQRNTNSRKRNTGKGRQRSNSESEEWYTDSGRFGPTNLLQAGSMGSALPVAQGGQNIPGGLLPRQVSTSLGGAHFPAGYLSQPSNGALHSDGRVPVGSSTNGAAEGKLNVQLVMTPGSLSPSGPNQAGGPAETRPSTLLDLAQALGLSAGQRGPEGTGTGLPSDANLCSEAPINALTALSNGTMLIFKGELFWAVDSIRGSIGPPQNITETLGVPSPIDTVFTRVGCNGNTYIIKGDQCWRLDENLVMEPGYPKPLTSEFPGLTGPISAALMVPATRNGPETVFFFKPGDMMQKFTFPPGSTASCRGKPRSSLQKKLAQKAGDALLSGEINIKISLTGFPTPITSALTAPIPESPSQFQHFVFSGPLYFRVQISGDLPALAKPQPPPILSPLVTGTSSAGQSQNPSQQANSIRFWLGCP